MDTRIVLDLVIGIAVLGLLIYRQLHARPVRGADRVILVLVVLGLIEAVQYFQKLHAGLIAIVAMAGSLVLAAAFGAARAATVRVWTQGGQAWSQGSLITAVLWVVALAAHLGYDYVIGQHKDIGNAGSATILLYLAVSLAVQRLIVAARAQRLDPASAGPAGTAAF